MLVGWKFETTTNQKQSAAIVNCCFTAMLNPDDLISLSTFLEDLDTCKKLIMTQTRKNVASRRNVSHRYLITFRFPF
jgi:hypothetical protein